MENLGKLRRKRGQYKGKVTRLVAALQQKIEEPSTTTFEVEGLMKQLQQKYEVFLEVHKAIQALLNEDEIVDDDEAQEEVVDAYTLLKHNFDWFLKRKTESVVPVEAAGLGDCIVDTRRTSSGYVDENRVNVKLPRLEIKKFDGAACKWQTFWSQFETAIDSNSRLGKSEKFVYLKSYLDGDALRSVMGLEITDANYDSAITLLKTRFGRKDLIINAHMQRLLKLVPVKSSTDTRSLRRLYDVIEIEIRSLESLGVNSSTFGTLLCPVIMSTIPEDLRLEFIVSRGQQEQWSVDDLLQYLRIQIESRERSQLMTRFKEGPERETRQKIDEKYGIRRRDDIRHSSASTLQTASERERCIFCKQNHRSLNCEKEASVKSRLLRDERRCYKCFAKGHSSTTCKAKDCEKCGRKHNLTICFAKPSLKVDVVEEQQSVDEKSNANDAVVTAANTKSKAVLLQTATAKLGKNGPSIRLLLDGGSETSFILKDLSAKQKLPIVDEDHVNVYSFGCKMPTSTIRRKVKVVLASFVDGKEATLIAAETETITAAAVLSPGLRLRKEMKRRHLTMAEVETNQKPLKIAVLIGSDYYWQVVTGKIEWISSTLVAVETIFGWCLQGPSTLCNNVKVNNVLHCTVEETLAKEVRAFWELEAIGVVDKHGSETQAEAKVLQEFNENIRFVDGRYTVGLPWKTAPQNLGDNFAVAKRRLQYLAKRFEKTPELFHRYEAVMREQINEGVAEPVSFTDSVDDKTYYMPHQAVIRDDKTTTKLRVVYDASSSEISKSSLNDCVECGPNLVPDLCAILLNFRRRKFGFMSDIKKAFLQIQVHEKDRNAMRFLWFKEGWKPGNAIDVDVYRMTRVLFGATCSPFLLGATIKFHLALHSEEFPEVVERLRNQLYVDDFIGSEETEAKLNEVKETSTNIMRKAGMELTKWSTNCKRLNAEWNSEAYVEEDSMPVTSEMSADKVLGLTWKKEEDVFSFDASAIAKFVDENSSTKRNVSKTFARIFDPLGFVSPFTIKAKVLFQRLWESGVKWDENIQSVLVDEWKHWCNDLRSLKLVQVNRCFETMLVKRHEIHIFADASESAYGAVAYLRTIYVDDSVSTKLIMSKSRVAPLKKITLPRLELMAAVIGSRLKVYLKAMFVDASFFMWSDAMIVIHWIKGSAKKWKPFIANRIGEIHSSTEPDSWNHCPGKENPADKLTRGLSVDELIGDELWWCGPQWLVKEENEWPKRKDVVSDNEIGEELRVTFVSTIVETQRDFVVDVKRFSSLRRLIRTTAWMQRFIRNCRSTEKVRGTLSVDEELQAETSLIKETQRIWFTGEKRCIEDNKELPNASILSVLKPFVDEKGVIRVKGRLENADISYGEKNPIVIPNDSYLAILLIVDAHRRVMHMGVMSTMTEIRSRFYIQRCRQMVKKVIGKCVICRRFSGRNFDEIAAPLPSDRVSPSTPFDVIGMDFAGPLIVDDTTKAYILLITCAVTRAVHLELVRSMKTEETIDAFRRFISRRGVPSTVYTDNGRTFKRVNKEIQSIYKQLSSTDIQEYFTRLRIHWKYIVERSPWWGGFWERMVRTTKSCLKKVLGTSTCSFEELTTVLCECEAVINSRPVTYVSQSVDEFEPLTPSHFLVGKRLTELPKVRKIVDDDLTRVSTIKRWQYKQRLGEHFWRRWQKEYLLDLQSAMKTKTKNSSTKPKVGDVVLIREDNVRRQNWSIGRIVETLEGRDHRIRACRIKTGKGSTICRPIQRLYLIEDSSTINGTETVPMGGVCCETSTNSVEKSRNVDTEDQVACKATLPSTKSQETSRMICADELSAIDANV